MSELLIKAKILFNKRIVEFGLVGRGWGKGELVCEAEFEGFECGLQAECDSDQTLCLSQLLKEVDGSVLE